MKRLFTILALLVLSVTAWAQGAEVHTDDESGLQFTVDEVTKTSTITGHRDKESLTKLEIPERAKVMWLFHSTIIHIIYICLFKNERPSDTSVSI